MVTKIVGMDATRKKANAIGVVLMVGAVEKIGLEMDVMELLGDLVIIYVFCNKTLHSKIDITLTKINYFKK
jgi:hypothetical protein